MTQFVNQPVVRRSFWTAWILIPVIVAAWHFGPGQSQLARDLAGDHIVLGKQAAASERFADASSQFATAMLELPEEDAAARGRLELEQARARIQAGEMIEGQEQLQQLLDALQQSGQAKTELATSTRHELATASYHTAWLMRLEGATADEWKPEAERARQQFRLLAEEQTSDQQRGEQFRKNLEATIRLEQMDLSTLLARPLPKNCPNCCKNLSQRKRKQCQSRCKGEGKKKGEKKEPQDVRKQLKKDRGAGINPTGGTGS